MSQHPPLLVVDVSGDPTQLGSQYGVQAADLIRGNVELYLRRFAAAGLARAAVSAAGAGFRQTTIEHFPRLAAMLDATAAAAGVPAELIYAVNARSELLYASPTCGSPGGAEFGECTSVGVLDSHTASGHTLLAQNWDWHPDHRPYCVLLRTEDERGHRVAALTEAGMLAKAGINSAGVGVCVNLLGSDRDGRPGGVPYHVLLRSVLEADSLSWALRLVMRVPRSASINLLIGQAYSAATSAGSAGGGEVIDVELAPGDAGWLHPVNGIVTHANHFETDISVYDTIKDWGGSSLFRAARARRLIEASDGPIALSYLRSVLSDHHSAPVSICRHADQRDDPADRSETIWTVLIDLDVRSMRLISGPPCDAKDELTVQI